MAARTGDYAEADRYLDTLERWKTVDPFAEINFIDQIDRGTAGN